MTVRLSATARERDDQGAVLILAVLFVLVVGLVGGALLLLTGSALSQTGSLQTDRSLSAAAESAVEVSIQNVRSLTTLATAPGYGSTSINPCPSMTVHIPEGGPTGTGSTDNIKVVCAVGTAPLPWQRSITFAGCPDGTSDSACLAGSIDGTVKPQSAAIVVATVTYYDLADGCTEVTFTNGVPDNCFSPAVKMDVTGWDVAKANH